MFIRHMFGFVFIIFLFNQICASSLEKTNLDETKNLKRHKNVTNTQCNKVLDGIRYFFIYVKIVWKPVLSLQYMSHLCLDIKIVLIECLQGRITLGGQDLTPKRLWSKRQAPLRPILFMKHKIRPRSVIKLFDKTDISLV
jgi:hypothetical protein